MPHPPFGDPAYRMACEVVAKVKITPENGEALYKKLFSEHPDVKKWFPAGTDFGKLGVKVLLSIHTLAHTWHDLTVFKHQVRQILYFHDRYKGFNGSGLYRIFLDTFLKFAESKGGVSRDEERSFQRMTNAFCHWAVDIELVRSTITNLIGKVPIDQKTGRELYAYMFDHAPQIRKWFKGAEHMTGREVMGCDRMDAQAIKIMLAMHSLANLWHDSHAFDLKVDQLVEWHDHLKGFNLTVEYYKIFFPLFLEFLKTKTHVTHNQEKAYNAMAHAFVERASTHVTPSH